MKLAINLQIFVWMFIDKSHPNQLERVKCIEIQYIETNCPEKVVHIWCGL